MFLSSSWYLWHICPCPRSLKSTLSWHLMNRSSMKYIYISLVIISNLETGFGLNHSKSVAVSSITTRSDFLFRICWFKLNRLQKYSSARNRTTAVEVNCYFGAWCSIHVVERHVAYVNSSLLYPEKIKLCYITIFILQEIKYSIKGFCLTYHFLAGTSNKAVILIDNYWVFYRVKFDLLECNISNITLFNLLQIL